MSYISRLRGKLTNTPVKDLGIRAALETFHLAAQTVPAYKDFLKQNGIDPLSIDSKEMFERLPIVTKENYLKKYPLRDLLINGDTSDAKIISLSSGSSGKPFYWPRGDRSIQDSAGILDDLFEATFETRTKETLCVMAFAMGTWIAGTYMLSAMYELARRGHKIVCITPGINKAEIIQTLSEIGGQFDQTIIMGYPPFIKDVVDAAVNEAIDMEKLKLRFVYAGENISENWRDYMSEKIRAKDIYSFSLNIFGTADAGIVGIESPFTVYLRKLIDREPALFNSFFPGAEILPTMVQYDPAIRYVEEVDGHVVFTANNSLPLIRYDIQDEGAVISLETISAKLAENKIVIPEKYAWFNKLPIIALFGRPDVAAMFYGLNIYPENIKYGLEVEQLQNYTTGKFIIKTEVNEKTLGQSLHLYVELKPNVLPEEGIKEAIFSSVMMSLNANNSEYHKLHSELKRKVEPLVHLLEFGSPEFKIGIKHKWVAKS